jgi:hypothetical protein
MRGLFSFALATTSLGACGGDSFEHGRDTGGTGGAIGGSGGASTGGSGGAGTGGGGLCEGNVYCFCGDPVCTPSGWSCSHCGTGGASSGGASGTGGAGGFGGCVDTPSAVDLNYQTNLGFSGADLLAKVGAEQKSDLKWLGSYMYASHSKSGTQTFVTLTFDQTSAVARFVDSTGGGCVGGDGPCLTCMPRLEIDINLKLVSEDGSLNDTLKVTLVSMLAEMASLSGVLAAEDVMGTYLDDVTPKTGYEVNGLHIEAEYGGVEGNLWAGYVAATLNQVGYSGSILQAHGYVPSTAAPGY